MGLIRIAVVLTIIGLVHSAAVVDPVTCSWDSCDQPCGSGNRVCQRSNGKTWNIACHVQDCTPFTGCGIADIVFVLDSSASIGEMNWWKCKQFLIDVTKGLVIGKDESRVSVVVYSNQAVTHWKLGAYNNAADLEAQIWGLDWVSGNTNTAAGLLHAKTVIETTGRAQVKHIVIVITDGKSNNQADLVLPRATEMHQMGIEVFAVGVSADVDVVELEDMASVPKDAHTYQATDYQALVAITNTLINDTCTAAGLTECAQWSDWSDCDTTDPNGCGDGLSKRTRECRFYLWVGAVPDIRTQTETEPCEVSCAACATCDYQEDGIGYLPELDNCHKFIQCQKLEDGTFIEHPQWCPGSQFWRQSVMGCGLEKDDGSLCIDGEIATDAPELTTAAVAACDKTEASTSGFYIWHVNGVDYTMPCGYGTVFSLADCGCVTGVNAAPDCTSDAMLEFPFNSNYDDICNRAAGTPWGNMKLENGAAYFDGTSKVEIGFLKNWFEGNPTTAMTVTLWFNYTGSNNAFEGLFSNGDCQDDASLLLTVGGGIAQGQLIADATAQFEGLGATTRQFLNDEWVFVALVYSGWDAKYYINGQMKEQKFVSGPIANTQCATSVGFTGVNNGAHFFEGYIDDVRVYTKTLWEHDINVLYNADRQ